MIVDEQGDWAGPIDWGDMHVNNPAVDLQIGWGLLPPDARAGFWKEYGSVTVDQLSQSRLVALYIALVLFEYASVESLPTVRREAAHALKNMTLVL